MSRDDTISREMALNSLIDNTHLDGYDLAEALDAIENKEKLPPVTHKSGKWIIEGIHWKPIFKCSECGSVIEEMPTVMDKPKYKGCPYCLAEMESSDADSD